MPVHELPTALVALAPLTLVRDLAHGRVRMVLGSLGGLRLCGIAAGEHLQGGKQGGTCKKGGRSAG